MTQASNGTNGNRRRRADARAADYRAWPG